MIIFTTIIIQALTHTKTKDAHCSPNFVQDSGIYHQLALVDSTTFIHVRAALQSSAFLLPIWRRESMVVHQSKLLKHDDYQNSLHNSP